MEERRLGPVVGLGTYGHVRRRRAPRARGRRRPRSTRARRCSTRRRCTAPRRRRSGARSRDARDEQRCVATKIWAESVEEGRAQYAADSSLFGRVEIEQIHNLVAWREQLPWLEDERDAGRIDRLGVTHWDSPARFDELEQALRTGRFDTVQIPLNPLERECEATDPAARRGARRRGDRDAPARRRGRRALRREPAAGALEPLRAFGVETWAQALLKWCLADPRVDLVIPATRRAERGAENAAAGEPPCSAPTSGVVEGSCVEVWEASQAAGQSARTSPGTAASELRGRTLQSRHEGCLSG